MIDMIKRYFIKMWGFKNFREIICCLSYITLSSIILALALILDLYIDWFSFPFLAGFLCWPLVKWLFKIFNI